MARRYLTGQTGQQPRKRRILAPQRPMPPKPVTELTDADITAITRAEAKRARRGLRGDRVFLAAVRPRTPEELSQYEADLRILRAAPLGAGPGEAAARMDAQMAAIDRLMRPTQ